MADILSGGELCLPDRLQLTSEEYHRHPAVGSTSLKRVLRSPAHYKQELMRPAPSTKAQSFGSLIHAAVLEPHRFRQNLIVKPKFAGKGCRALEAAWEKEHAGFQIIAKEDLETIEGILHSLENHHTASELLRSGFNEESFFWQDPQTGLVCKCRPDSWKDGMLVDIKSTLNASPQEFPRSIANMMYHLQAAFYLDGVSAVLGEPFHRFALVAVEKVPPYAIATYIVDEATIEVGRMHYRKALKTLRQCKMRNQYPAYPDRLISTSLPSWAWPVESEEGDFGLRAI